MNKQSAPAALSTDQIASALAPFFPNMSEIQLALIQRYVNLLLSWNRSVNLTAIENPIEIVTRHFGESLFAASVVRFCYGRLADVGTGAGFPGLPLKILQPELNTVLIEPNVKKAAFLTEVVQDLSLKQVQVVRTRFEEHRVEPGSIDFVCCRAMGEYKRLLKWSQTALNRDGRIILWLGTDDSITVGKAGRWIWDVPVRLPESKRRVLLVGRLAQ